MFNCSTWCETWCYLWKIDLPQRPVKRSSCNMRSLLLCGVDTFEWDAKNRRLRSLNSLNVTTVLLELSNSPSSFISKFDYLLFWLKSKSTTILPRLRISWVEFCRPLKTSFFIIWIIWKKVLGVFLDKWKKILVYS